MAKDITLKYYSDPGHSWIAIKIKTLFLIDVLNQMSIYSYVRGQTLYAEYHCDAGKAIQALKAAGYEVTFAYSHTDKRSPIRSYDEASQKNIENILKKITTI